MNHNSFCSALFRVPPKGKENLPGRLAESLQKKSAGMAASAARRSAATRIRSLRDNVQRFPGRGVCGHSRAAEVRLRRIGAV